MSQPGIPIVISGPSGVGKGTLIKELLNRDSDLALSISMTTRAPRPGETDGQDYYFVKDERFEDAVANGEMIEWAKVYEHSYGTPKTSIDEKLMEGFDVLLDIDIQGGAAVRSQYMDAVLVFIIPPSIEELMTRINNRPKSETDDIQRRLDVVREELALSRFYDYIVVNDTLEEALSDLQTIVKASRLMSYRNLDKLQFQPR